MRKIFGYDIWDGDKGIIIANTYKGACRKFRKEYPGTPIAGVTKGYEDSYGESEVCDIREVAKLQRGTGLYYLYD